ncbi:MAG: carbohydrate ABC transporter permease [Sphaerochaetaceae bacterium]|jgi:putative aldouronate transport system permease protein|nr:carbohydrate ABC transporter permease [Sphaerochaetaceae bacterium]NLO60569.1 carbohydrate ABC transporter permease [Spirochaetales bacterium]MDD2405659.1 carbohydrate ABC transporter permease [Sphaerochaetaceae bacterium]MDD3670452.1 carbohydrate ABC transporter permease [Sphaerochaetaceae bacterium]MDD4258401.1 carbohydrate ABC transporter permease [Sphaerochaetaceae bacterium]
MKTEKISFSKPSAVRLSASDKVFYTVINTLLIVLFFIISIPLWSTITLSFRPNDFVGTNFEGMFLMPWNWSLSAYKALMGNNGFIMAFWNSIKIMGFGVACALFFTVPLAYALSIRSLPGRAFLTVLILIPHMFDVGMIPSFLMVKDLGLIDHLAAVFLPTAVSTYNCLIMKGFFEGIPEELKESARIDGAPELYLLLKIIIPLSKPIIMSVGLFYAVSFWNDFFHPMLYLNSNNLMPLPILLRNILMASGMNEYVEVTAFGEAPIQAIKAASVFLAAIPMVIAYPFIQKYFAKGTLLGSVKG